MPSEVPELLREALAALNATERAVAFDFFAQRSGRSGTSEMVLQTESIRDEVSGAVVAESHVVLKLNFDTWTWKRVRRKAPPGAAPQPAPAPAPTAG
jgi:hypothetical protein